jgi:tRNA nucleotidyltransferase (CCA-adding enzyme)
MRQAISLRPRPMNRLHPPSAVLEIAERLEGAGFEAWCVGGAIRDALLGYEHLDWDLATSATPTEVRELFGARRTIPVGVAFGTVGVLDRNRIMHEVTTFRRDVRTDGRHAEVEFGVSLEEDLARRDFTINAIAYSPRLREVRDPFGGQHDLASRVLRAVGNADARMREDRLRALRAIRFAARFDFAIDGATRRAIEASAPFLGRLSPERVKQEIDKTLQQVKRPSAAFGLWQATGAFKVLVPPLHAAASVALAVPDHLAMPGGVNRPARLAIRIAGLLASLSAEQAAAVLTGLRSSRQEIHMVATLIGAWHAVGDEVAAGLSMSESPANSAVRNWVARVGRQQLGAFMRLAGATWTARRDAGQEAPSARSTRALYRRMSASALRDPLDLGSLAVDGDDLRRIGIPSGPGLGKILQALLAAVVDDPARNVADWLLQQALQLQGALKDAE